ncbi:type II secretion system F family protein (plasmid) [Cupriavidus pinatubonensis]|uniref:type II secretion system F family protein n=1 Tax=Cupriavidus pinatubonensis TaxID=248026 RepID=UPI001C73459B|nr:type II secretion system F family protein [Cupriavidus pinatubonensis]QYY33637.1 type II secretion system F family protein [Cupriavidus pinatubonensis]
MLDRVEDLWDHLQHWRAKRAIGVEARIDFYNQMSLMLRMGLQIMTALDRLYVVESNEGRRPGRPAAVMLADIMHSTREGKSLGEALERWGSPQEVALVKAGDEAGNLEDQLTVVAEMLAAQGEMLGTIFGAMAYPLVLLSSAFGMLYMISAVLVPKLSKLTPPDRWDGAATLLNQVAGMVNDYWTVVFAVPFIAGAIAWSIPNLSKSELRFYLDKVPPWSFYRALHGSGFLKNMSVMLKAGIQMNAALLMLSQEGGPWLKTRIQAILHGINQGKTLGEAMHTAGYEFPDPRAVQILRAVSDVDGFEESMSLFADAWMKKSLASVKVIGRYMLGVGIAIAGGLLVLMVAGIFGLIQSTIGSLG